ncbi:MAG: hypothetical protein ACR2OO_15335 [Thermomicrobiales bacterium]
MPDSPSRPDDRTRRPEPVTSRKAPPAPGGARSPQLPGMTPDHSTVPGHFSETNPKAGAKLRPLSQAGTAEEIMRVYKRKPEGEIKPEDFEQATASIEELRKAHVADLPSVRPALPAPAAPSVLAAAEEPPAIAPSTPATS